MIEAVLMGLFGLLIGSFLNVCIYRLPQDLSPVTPRSYCTSCEKTIAWYDNVPVLSYFLLSGRCRKCGAAFSWIYPLVEITTGLLFFLSIQLFGWNPYGWKMCIFSAILVDLIVTDFTDRILPDEFTIGGTVLGVLLSVIAPPNSTLAPLFLPFDLPLWMYAVSEAVLGATVTSGLLWLTGEAYLRIRKREGLGFGDVKMLLTVGAFLGLPAALLTVFLGSIIGSVGGILFIWLTRKDATYELPFGSFLGIAALLVALFGERMMGLVP